MTAIHKYIYLYFVPLIFMICCGCKDPMSGYSFLSRQCHQIKSVSRKVLSKNIRSGVASCTKTSAYNVTTYHTSLPGPLTPVPIVAYATDKSPSKGILIYVHGGPRISISDDAKLIGAFPPGKAPLLIVVDYIGGLNRSLYPQPEFDFAAHEVASLIDYIRKNSRPGTPIVLAGDSIGGPILARACHSGCKASVVLMAPVFQSLSKEQRAFFVACAGKSRATDVGDSRNCGVNKVPSVVARIFRNGSYAGDASIAGNNLITSFAGPWIDAEPDYHTLFSDRYAAIIYDPADPIIGVEEIRRSQDWGSHAPHLVPLGGFSHPTFYAWKNGLSAFATEVLKAMEFEADNKGVSS